MRFVSIAGKIVNVDKIRYVNHREDDTTGRVYCNFIFDREDVLQEVYKDFDAFEQAMIKYGIFPEKTKEIHHLKKLCIIGEELIKKFTKKAGRR